MQYRLKVYRPADGLTALSLSAPDDATAVAEAERKGYKVISLRSRRASAWKPARQKFSVALFSQELLSLLEAGLGLVEVVSILERKSKNDEVRHVLEAVVRQLNEGVSFSAALEMQPAAFSPLYIATIRTAERTGDLAASLRRFLAYHTQVNQVRQKVVSASVYPAVLGIVGIAVIVFLLGYVVPRFSRIYEDIGGDLPWTSQLLMKWGRLVDEYGLLLFAGVGFLAVVLAYFLSKASVRAVVSRWCWALPGIGQKIQLYELARFARTLAMLLSGGVPFSTALIVVRDLLSQPALQQSLANAARLIKEGRTVSDAFGSQGLATEVGVRLLLVGERSGELSTALERIAKMYEDEVSKAVDWFSRLFEPLLMVAIGGVIGLVVVLMYLPIFELANNLQ
ncbi:type II secretion system F family protein [Pseudoduganella flava]|uniref:Type II secretion system F family protein n=1 Tax=Pseudoduganella flava TaxID=871742 RepID=A0ABX6FW81_9BURK|nr:type II secretion system F family protein [Pseudoduganella flava]QGZ41350.1 type II secretion system F family protein [Pseudoduganella flava]